MTDDSATLRAMAAELLERLRPKLPLPSLNAITRDRRAAREIIEALLASQASWAKEKAELERQLAEADGIVNVFKEALLDEGYGIPGINHLHFIASQARHASRPVTVKE